MDPPFFPVLKLDDPLSITHFFRTMTRNLRGNYPPFELLFHPFLCPFVPGRNGIVARSIDSVNRSLIWPIPQSPFPFYVSYNIGSALKSRTNFGSLSFSLAKICIISIGGAVLMLWMKHPELPNKAYCIAVLGLSEWWISRTLLLLSWWFQTRKENY